MVNVDLVSISKVDSFGIPRRPTTFRSKHEETKTVKGSAIQPFPKSVTLREEVKKRESKKPHRSRNSLAKGVGPTLTILHREGNIDTSRIQWQFGARVTQVGIHRTKDLQTRAKILR